MTASVVNYSNREAWLSARRIGASDAAAILGVLEWKSRYSVWAEKAHGTRLEGEAPAEYIHWGTILEGPIRDEYQRRAERSVIYPGPWSVCTHPEHSWMTCSLDGTVVSGQGVEVAGVFEAKTAGAYRSDEWSDEPPLAYQIQAQHQMAVTGLTWASLVCLIGGQKLVWFDLKRNDEFIAVLIDRLSEFWHQVETKEPPPVDGSEATKRALKALHPADNGESIELPEAAGPLWLERQLLSEQIKEFECRKDAIDNQFKAWIGGNTYGTLQGDCWTLKTQTRASYVAKESTFRTLKKKGGK